MSLRQGILGVILVVVALFIVTSYVLWEDGKQFAAGKQARRRAPSGVANPSYLDLSRYQWKTAERLRQYVIERQNESVQDPGVPSKP